MFYLESLNNKFARYVDFEFLCDKDLSCAQLRAFLSVRFFTTKRMQKRMNETAAQPTFRLPDEDSGERMREFLIPSNEISYVVEIPGHSRAAAQEVLHNDNGPALLVYDQNNTLRMESYYCCNKLHNYRRPAVRYWDMHGRLICERWYRHGLLHRASAHGLLHRASAHGLLHRASQDSPAVVFYDRDGQIRAEEWFYNGEHCRPSGGPAYIKYSENRFAINLVVRDNAEGRAADNKKLNASIIPCLTEALVDLDNLFQYNYDCEEYYYDGKLHRSEVPCGTEGHIPAVIRRDRERITYLGFYWNGMRSRAHTQISDEDAAKWRETEIKMQDIFNIRTGLPTELEFFYDQADGLESKFTWRFRDMIHRDHDDMPAVVYRYRGGAMKFEYYFMGRATMYTLDSVETAYGVQNSAGGAYKANYRHSISAADFNIYATAVDVDDVHGSSDAGENELFVRLLYAKKLMAGITSEAMTRPYVTDDDSDNRTNVLFEIYSYKKAYGYTGNIEDLLSADARREVESTCSSPGLRSALENFLSRWR